MGGGGEVNLPATPMFFPLSLLRTLGPSALRGPTILPKPAFHAAPAPLPRSLPPQVRLARSLKMDPERPEYHRVTLQWSR